MDLYIEAYGAFHFSSRSELVSDRDPQEAKTSFARDEHGNYHLERVPFAKESAVEVYSIERKTYLRSGRDQEFRIVMHQVEFDRWLAKAVHEVLALYAASSLDLSAPSGVQDGLNCWVRGPTSLCVDPQTGLPLQGTVFHSMEQGWTARVKFAITPGSARPVVILPPGHDRPKVAP